MEVQTIIDAASFLANRRKINEDGSTEESTSNSDSQKQTKILLVGYSYGSLMAGSASASIPQCVGVVYIACPFSVQQCLLLFNARYHLRQSKLKKDLPRLFIHGSIDNFTSLSNFNYYMDEHFSLLDHTRAVILPGADHFFHGRETEILKSIEEWICSIFPTMEGDIQRLKKLDIV